jgi:dUTP pyrophosphatase
MFSVVKRLMNFAKKTVGIVSGYLPEYKTEGSACFDFQASTTHTFKSGELYVMGTGVKCEIPKGWCMLVFARSSLGLKKLIIPNSVGVIDSDYRGEIKVPLMFFGDEEIVIEKGCRIAQGMLVKVTKAHFEKRDYLSETMRGIGGFGSTGDK